MSSWGAPGSPINNLLNIKKLIDKEEFRPFKLVMTTNQKIHLEAYDLFSEWKLRWRKQHRILAFLEKISNKITGRPQQ